MPLGNGAALGLPSSPLRVLQNPRTYYRSWTPGGGAGGNTDENPIAPLTHYGRLSPYAEVVANTPGLMHWWRFDRILTDATVHSSSNGNANFANSVGPTTLRGQGAGVPKLAPGLIQGEAGIGCDLNGGYLDAFDYRALTTSNEVMAAEIWVNIRSIKADAALMGEWASNVGWMLYTGAGGSDINLYTSTGHLDAAGALTVGRHHIVGVWGGQQAAVPDYYCRTYLDGVQIASGLVTGSNSVNADTTRFEIGNYSNGVGTNNLDAIVDEAAIYSRMLQPEEVVQHYKAAFARAA